MGANATQALAIVLFLIGFTVLAGGFAGGGALSAIEGVGVIGAACFFFPEWRPWGWRRPRQGGHGRLRASRPPIHRLRPGPLLTRTLRTSRRRRPTRARRVIPMEVSPAPCPISLWPIPRRA